jgi:hypothetical protein
VIGDWLRESEGKGLEGKNRPIYEIRLPKARVVEKIPKVWNEEGGIWVDIAWIPSIDDRVIPKSSHHCESSQATLDSRSNNTRLVMDLL